jgi:hypothetical protein
VLVGWWDAQCPVTVQGDSDVIASVFVRPGAGCGVVVAVASWSKAAVANVTLVVDWWVHSHPLLIYLLATHAFTHRPDHLFTHHKHSFADSLTYSRLRTHPPSQTTHP